MTFTSRLMLVVVTITVYGNMFPVWAGEWITLELGEGEAIKAFAGRPAGAGKHPGVIYHHGSLVRRMGAAEAANRHGYDVRDFVNALNADGYVAIAPVRDLVKGGRSSGGKVTQNLAEDFIGGVEQGRRATLAALRYLQNEPTVDGERLGLMGFSEGGLITAWMASDPRLRAVVIMSPALFRQAEEHSIGAATQSDQFARFAPRYWSRWGRTTTAPL